MVRPMGSGARGEGAIVVTPGWSGQKSSNGRPIRLLLAGGGHAHLGVLKSWIARPPHGIETSLITSERYLIYSGMVPAWITDPAAAEDLRIDLVSLADRAGIDCIIGSVVGMDANQREVVLNNGERLSFDLLSIATGGDIDTSTLADLGPRLLPVRPMPDLVRRWPLVRDTATRTPGFRVAVVGGGAAGVELALAISSTLAGSCAAPVMLVSDAEALLPGHSSRARRLAQERLAHAGVELVEGHASATPDGLLLDSGRRIPAGCVVAATGTRAPRWFRSSSLQLDGQGFVSVGPDLRSQSHPHVFAAGDIASWRDRRGGRTVARSGVHAVQMGPVLAENLRRTARDAGARLRVYRPRRRSLYLLSTGDGRAILSWGSVAVAGRWVQRLKNHIDRRFVREWARLGSGAKGVAWSN